MPSVTKQRRKRFARAPVDQEPKLNARTLSIFDAIQHFGGVLSTAQLALLFWPPSITRKLQYWKLDQDQVEALIKQHSAADLDEKVECLKFLLKVHRLSSMKTITSSPYVRFWEWLMEIKAGQPKRFAELEQAVKTVAEVEPKVWLLKAIQEDFQPPAAFVIRPRYASEFVSSTCVNWLRRLYDAEWLDRDEPSVPSHQGRGQTLWYLTKRARNYLAKAHGVSVRDITWKPVGTYNNDQHLPHRLAVIDFRISVHLAVERLGYQLKTWLGESELQHRHRKYKVRLLTDPDDPASRERVETLEPDGHWWLYTDKNFFHFNEIDRGTETLQYVDPNRKNEYWAWKIRKYGAFYDEWYEQLYPEAKKSMRILVVTTTDTRLANMVKVCREVAGRRAAGRYWLTTFSRIAPSYQDYFRETVLTGPIWQRADQPGKLHPLVW